MFCCLWSSWRLSGTDQREEDNSNQSDGEMKDSGVRPLAHEEYQMVLGLKELWRLERVKINCSGKLLLEYSKIVYPIYCMCVHTARPGVFCI